MWAAAILVGGSGRMFCGAADIADFDAEPALVKPLRAHGGDRGQPEVRYHGDPPDGSAVAWSRRPPVIRPSIFGMATRFFARSVVLERCGIG